MFPLSSTMVDYLDDKFKESIVKEFDSSFLEENRAATNLLVHPTIDGSSTFEVIVFKPYIDHLKAGK